MFDWSWTCAAALRHVMIVMGFRYRLFSPALHLYIFCTDHTQRKFN
jgi:hypothetical protein